MDLTARYVVSIKSATLANVVTAILNKLNQVTGEQGRSYGETCGFLFGSKHCSLAQNWGNPLPFVG